MTDRIVKSEAEWRAALTDEQYEIARNKGTERAFAGCLWDHKAAGSYRCICCDEPLFSSETKYDSGSGWPSFHQAIDKGKVKLVLDKSHGMHRTEATCARCDAHLGHVFSDGPAPTGERYCINSASLKFEAGEEA